MAARLVHRPRQPEHAPPGRRPRRLRVRQRLLRRRPAVLDRGRQRRRHAAAAPGRALLARRQRHALRPGAGLQHRRAFLRLPARQLRRALRRRRPDGLDRPKMMSIGMHSPPARQARPDRRAAALPRPHRRHEQVWVARRIDIARHWKAVHPYAARRGPVARPGSCMSPLLRSPLEDRHDDDSRPRPPPRPARRRGHRHRRDRLAGVRRLSREADPHRRHLRRRRRERHRRPGRSASSSPRSSARRSSSTTSRAPAAASAAPTSSSRRPTATP